MEKGVGGKGMKFSILVPVYNVEQYLEQCMESILNQSYQDYEVILVDDGSTDKSGVMCDEYASKYPGKVKVIHKQNQGLISARRVGIAEATGDFCIFVDSDDFVELNLLETVQEYLSKDVSVDLLIYSFQYCRDGKIAERTVKTFEEESVWETDKKQELYETLIYTSKITSIWSKAIRTSVLKADLIDYTQYYSKNMAEDLLQSLYPMTHAKKVMYTNKILYNYRINESSSSRSYTYKTIPSKNMLHVYEKIKEYFPIWGMDDKKFQDQLDAKWMHETMYMFCKYYEYASSKEELEKILNYDWKSMLPESACDIENPYISDTYKELFTWWNCGKYSEIHRYFWRKKWYQRIRNWKRKLLS